ncbi:MAG: hypothetical protein JL50_13145 [Peptococcaceae bacterium BICA1-7]|nr:MAG: hypothetical protein JL50_13145 [Peptococcaceae bacterium BICA1-7]
MGLVRVIEGGALTTVQDLGRFGYQGSGIPVSGPMDRSALYLANAALGSPEGSPGLECTLSGPVLQLDSDELLCITGGELGVTLDGYPCPMWRPVPVRKNSVLSFSGPKKGLRSYICFKGGIRCPAVLGSSSTLLVASLGGIEGRELRAGDVFLTGGQSGSLPREADREIPAHLRTSVIEGCTEVRVLPGPQDNIFGPGARETFLASEYTVTSRADRMGYLLSGPPVPAEGLQAGYSRGIPLGGIQIDGQGLPIVALSDRQTVGGYPQIAVVISADMDLFAQLKPGDRIRFNAVTLDAAQEMWRQKILAMRQFKEKALHFWKASF